MKTINSYFLTALTALVALALLAGVCAGAAPPPARRLKNNIDSKTLSDLGLAQVPGNPTPVQREHPDGQYRGKPATQDAHVTSGSTSSFTQNIGGYFVPLSPRFDDFPAQKPTEADRLREEVQELRQELQVAQQNARTTTFDEVLASRRGLEKNMENIMIERAIYWSVIAILICFLFIFRPAYIRWSMKRIGELERNLDDVTDERDALLKQKQVIPVTDGDTRKLP